MTDVDSFKSSETPLPAVKPLDFDKPMSELPSSHLCPSSAVQDRPSDHLSVPIIDLSQPSSQKQLDLIRYACDEWGFFYIINHDVPEKIIEDFKTGVMELFGLPMEVKLKVLKSGNDDSGYGHVPVERFSQRKMWYEGFGVQSNFRDLAKKLWPPHGNPEICQAMEEYQKEMKRVSEKVLILMLASVGLTPEDTNWSEPKTKENPFGPHGTHFQLHSSPPCPNPENTMGLNEHTDTSIVTIVDQVNHLNGLQVLHNEKWVPVDPMPGAFVVSIGDLAHYISNGRFVCPIHRVLPNRQQRYSSAYFYCPPIQNTVAPMPKFVGPGEKPKFRPTTKEEHLQIKRELNHKVFDYMRADKEENHKG